jgi:hypothetical protein
LITSFEQAMDWYAKFQGEEADEEELRPVAFFALDAGRVVGLILDEDEVDFVDATGQDGFLGFEFIDADDIEDCCDCDDESNETVIA